MKVRAYLVVVAENITTVKACATVVVGANNQEEALKKGAIKFFGNKAKDQWFTGKIAELSLIRAIPRYDGRYYEERKVVAEDMADKESVGDWKGRLINFIEERYRRPEVTFLEKELRHHHQPKSYDNYYNE